MGTKIAKSVESYVTQQESVAQRLEREEAIAALNKRRQGEKLTRAEITAIRKFEEKRDEELRHRILSSLSQKTLVDILGTSRKVLLEWESEGLPRNSDRTYNLYSVLPWLKTRWYQGTKEAKDSPALERYRLAKARMAEVELAERRGKLIDIESVERGRVERIHMVKRIMFSIPNSASPVLATMSEPREIHKYLNDIMIEICETFAGNR